MKISGLNEAGEEVEWTVSGWSARLGQHEYDHLQGKIFIDRADLSTLSFEYWRLVTIRHGDFRLGFSGIKQGPTKFISKFFHQK